MKLNLKLFLLLFFLSISAIQLKAAPVDAETAMAEAMDFLSASPLMKSKGFAAASPADVTLACTYTSDANGGNGGNDANCFYIFNRGNGFVIISADDRLPQVLAYSENGAFDPSRIPENMKNWLEGYRDEIAAALPLLPENSGNLRKVMKAPKRNPIEPLLSTKWDQGKPFNNDCPIDSRNNQRSATGCVATAMSQIMKFHSWPDKPEGVNAGVTFFGTTYDWKRMIDVYEEGKYSSAESSAVATLMRQVGAAVNMQYSSYASGAYDYDVQLALTKYFKYSKGLTFYWKDYTPQREWNNIVYSELEAGRPVYYSGSSAQGGHAFVCDGYSENEYFHFNWGWGGYEDGYYLLSALNPASGGAGSYEGGYNSRQSILTGIMPISKNPDATMQVAILATGGFYYDSSQGTRFVVQNGTGGENLFYNPLGFNQVINIGLKVEDENGNATYLTADKNVALQPFYGFPYISAVFPKLSDGVYRVTPVISDATKNEWIPVEIPLAEQNYVKLTVKDSKLTFSNEGPDSEFTPKLIVGEPQFPKTIYAGTSIPVRVPVLNVGEGDYNAQIGFSLFDANDDFGDIASYQDNLAVAAKSFYNLDMTLDGGVRAGSYVVSMMDLNNNSFISNYKVTVKDRRFETPSADVTIKDIYPSFYTSEDESPIYFTAVNSASTQKSLRFAFELLDANTLEQISVLNNTQYVEVPGKFNGRVSVNPFDFGIDPGEYLWRAINPEDGSPLSLPAPLIVTSAEISSGGLTYIVTDEANSKAILAAPVSDPYSGVVNVRSNIDGYDIVALRNDAFTFATANEVTLPAAIDYIPAGCFYDDSQLNLLTLNTTSLAGAGSEAFNYANTNGGKCWLNVPEEIANTFRYSESSRWRGFLQPRWNLELTNVTVASGMPDMAMLGDNYSYCVNPESTLEISFEAPAGKNVKVIVIDADRNWVMEGTVASGDKVNLPALGRKGAGRVIASATTDEVSVEELGIDAEDEICDVFSIDGRIVMKSSTAADRRTLPAGIYILSTGRKLIAR